MNYSEFVRSRFKSGEKIAEEMTPEKAAVLQRRFNLVVHQSIALDLAKKQTIYNKHQGLYAMAEDAHRLKDFKPTPSKRNYFTLPSALQAKPESYSMRCVSMSSMGNRWTGKTSSRNLAIFASTWRRRCKLLTSNDGPSSKKTDTSSRSVTRADIAISKHKKGRISNDNRRNHRRDRSGDCKDIC